MPINKVRANSGIDSGSNNFVNIFSPLYFLMAEGCLRPDSVFIVYRRTTCK